MLPGSDIPSLRPVLTVQALAPLDRAADPRQESLSRLLQISIGQQVQGKIMTALDDGSYLVKIADTTARMQLLEGLRPGEFVSLTMVGKAPRPTFLLRQESDSTPASLSKTGLLIDQLLKAATNGSAPYIKGEAPLIDPAASASRAAAAMASASLLQDAAPLQDTAPVDTRAVAASLQSAVASSGLFYESHVAQWADGRMPLDDLQREPQARYGNHFQPDMSETDALPDPRHVQIASIVGAQLDALENQRFTWRGDAWPGREMAWDVERQEEDRKQPHIAPEPVWQSSVRFEFPQLGAVAASIRLSGNRLQMQVRAGTADAATMLTLNASDLADALLSTGLSLDRLIVNQHADTEI